MPMVAAKQILLRIVIHAAPQNCDTCGMFLENSLTTDGIKYVREELGISGRNLIHEMWRTFYASSL